MSPTIDRREFLARTTLGVAAFGVFNAPPLGAQTGMFISLPPWAVARNVGWPDQARLAARVGYGGIDWAFGPARQAGVEATRALLAELKIRPTIVNLPMNNPLGPDEAAFTAQLPKLAEDAAFCQAIGCRNFQLVLRAVTGGPSKQDFWTLTSQPAVRHRRRPREARHAARPGVSRPLVFRAARGGGAGRRGGAPPDPNAPPPPPPPAPVPFVWTLTETVKLGAEAGPNVGATLDAWHWFHSGGTVADILATDKSRIIHVHVSDAKPMPPEDVQDNMRWLPGEGIIDLVGFFQALKKIGWEGGVAPETIGPRIPGHHGARGERAPRARDDDRGDEEGRRDLTRRRQPASGVLVRMQRGPHVRVVGHRECALAGVILGRPGGRDDIFAERHPVRPHALHHAAPFAVARIEAYPQVRATFGHRRPPGPIGQFGEGPSLRELHAHARTQLRRGFARPA